MAISVTIEDYSKEFLEELQRRVPVALEECGLAAEGFAKRLCAVDTGLLRNSITHVLSGESPPITTYSDNNGVQHGEYSGAAPASDGKEMVMYLGTNVEYAAYVEMGTKHTPAQPFIEPAIVNHANDYKKLIEKRLKG